MERGKKCRPEKYKHSPILKPKIKSPNPNSYSLFRHFIVPTVHAHQKKVGLNTNTHKTKLEYE